MRIALCLQCNNVFLFQCAHFTHNPSAFNDYFTCFKWIWTRSTVNDAENICVLNSNCTESHFVECSRAFFSIESQELTFFAFFSKFKLIISSWFFSCPVIYFDFFFQPMSKFKNGLFMGKFCKQQNYARSLLYTQIMLILSVIDISYNNYVH